MTARILPEYKLIDVITEMENIKLGVEKDFGVKIEIEIPQNIQAPEPTSKDAPVVKLIQKSIKKILNIDAKTIGIGGGTVAAHFRMQGYSAALWSTNDNTMHSPNEYSIIINALNDAKVFADIMINNEY